MGSLDTARTSRGQFLRNAGRGGIVLASSGGVLAGVTSSAFAAGPTAGDVETLQAAYTAESLAVVVYSAILKNFHASSIQGSKTKTTSKPRSGTSAPTRRSSPKRSARKLPPV